MSYRNYELAIEKAKGCREYRRGNGFSEEVISSAEKQLGIKFSKQLRHFYSEVGTLSFYSVIKIFDIDPDYEGFDLCDIYDIEEGDDPLEKKQWIDYDGNLLKMTLQYREEHGLPFEWFPFLFIDTDTYAYLDYSQINSDDEPRIIAVYDRVFAKEEKPLRFREELANDFGDFLLDMVEKQLASPDNNEPKKSLRKRILRKIRKIPIIGDFF